MEDQGEEASGISVEPQPESHVEPVSTRGKGKGKGRGKKSQPSNSEPMVRKISCNARHNVLSKLIVLFTCKFKRKGLLNISFTL